MKTLIMGDLSPTATTNTLFQKMDTVTLFTDTLSLFEGNDINFVNLECALTECTEAIKKFGPNNMNVIRSGKIFSEEELQEQIRD